MAEDIRGEEGIVRILPNTALHLIRLRPVSTPFGVSRKHTRCDQVMATLNQPISLNHHRLQHIQNRHHLPLRLPEESVPYAWIKAAESFEQLGEMGFELRADRQD